MALQVIGAVPPPAINKGGIKHPKNKLIPKKIQCYSYDRGGNSKGYVLKPLVDYLSITVPFESDDFHSADENIGMTGASLTEYVMSPDNPDWGHFSGSQLPNKVKRTYKHYEHNGRLTDLPGLAAIQYGPANKNHNYMRLTLVPSEWDKGHVNRFWAQLQRLVAIDDFKAYVAEKGRITRVDFAIGFLNIALQDLLFVKPGSERKSLAYHGSLGELETLYIAANNVKNVPQSSKAYVYDKQAKLISQSQPEIHKGLLHCRCEFRHKPETKKTELLVVEEAR